MNTFLAWLRRILGGQAKPPVFPAPVPPPRGEPMSEAKSIDGGRAHMGMPRYKGPQGQEIGGKRRREVEAGDNLPTDSWVPFDCTPTVGGKDCGPMPDSEVKAHPKPEDQTNPDMQGVTSWDGKTTEGTSGDHQVVRLACDKHLDKGDVDVVHEYASHGCNGRFKFVDAEGYVDNIRFDYHGGSIPCRPSRLNVGRQEEKPSAGADDGSRRGHR